MLNVKVSIVSGKKWAIVDGKAEIEPSINFKIHSPRTRPAPIMPA